MGEVQRQAAAAAAGAGAGGSGGSSFGGAAAAGASGSAAAAGGGGGKQRAGSAGRKRTTAAAAADAGEGASQGEGGSQQQEGAAAAAVPKAKKKRVTAPKEYVPAVGSANYAFVITLYLVRPCWWESGGGEGGCWGGGGMCVWVYVWWVRGRREDSSGVSVHACHGSWWVRWCWRCSGLHVLHPTQPPPHTSSPFPRPPPGPLYYTHTQRHRTCSHHLSKEELLSAAEASRLADTPLRGNTNGWAAQRGQGKWYDGWSCIKVGVVGGCVCGGWGVLFWGRGGLWRRLCEVVVARGWGEEGKGLGRKEQVPAKAETGEGSKQKQCAGSAWSCSWIGGAADAAQQQLQTLQPCALLHLFLTNTCAPSSHPAPGSAHTHML